MPICPVCKYEYHDGRDECIDCGVALVDHLSDEDQQNIDGITYVPFRSFEDRLQAEIAIEALANDGIPSIIKSDDAYSFAEAGVMLWVAEDSLDLAEEIADHLLDTSRPPSADRS